MKTTVLPALFASVAISGLLAGTAPAHAALPAQVASTPVPSLAPMIKQVSPTVVGIATKGTVRQQRNPLYDDPFFRRFFGMPEESESPRERSLAAGSGVVVDAAKGYIITNAHVVANATTIDVTLDDGAVVQAEIVGTDKATDIALLQVEDARLNAITLGNSASLEVGDFVVAIGNPFGLEHTVTSGIVSALGRSGIGPNSDGYQDFIQTDASINPGNSGGALVNLRGELVGINAAILSGGGGNIGIGFAIPVNMVKGVMEQLIEHGEVKRGVLGVGIGTFTPDVASAMGAQSGLQGALVQRVEKNSGAEAAGIKVGDIITSVDGKPVKNPSELKNAIGMRRLGERVRIGLMREGKALTLSAAITEASATVAAAATDIHRALEGAELSDTPSGEGVVIRSVAPNSIAAASDLQANDVIFGANRRRVSNLEQLREVAAASQNNILVLNIRRGSFDLLVVLR